VLCAPIGPVCSCLINIPPWLSGGLPIQWMSIGYWGEGGTMLNLIMEIMVKPSPVRDCSIYPFLQTSLHKSPLSFICF
jgi:hypothetical protein